jgi:hypothetical protein
MFSNSLPGGPHVQASVFGTHSCATVLAAKAVKKMCVAANIANFSGTRFDLVKVEFHTFSGMTASAPQNC